jgi:predicted PurR-regulated permease PerM
MSSPRIIRRPTTIAHVVSLIVLVALLGVAGLLFYWVMIGFALPLFMAVVLVIVFRPVHMHFMMTVGGRQHLAAGLTTLFILFVVLAPLVFVLYQAALESIRLTAETADAPIVADQPNDIDAGTALVEQLIEQAFNWLPFHVTAEQRQQAQEWVVARLAGWAQAVIGFTGRFLIGLGIMIVALYFFLADGPAMVRAMSELLPIEPGHLNELLDRFTTVTRAVVVATLLAAIVQGVLAGVGFALTGFESVFLLTAATILMALVPFVGPAAVWLPCALYLYFYEQNVVYAVGLAVYGAAIVSTADNVVRPLVLRGRSRLHPLLALLSVIGGLQAMGAIGIFVGPIVVAFLQTLLKIVHDEVVRMDGGTPDSAGSPPLQPPGGEEPGGGVPKRQEPGREEPLALRFLLRRVKMMFSRSPRRK